MFRVEFIPKENLDSVLPLLELLNPEQSILVYKKSSPSNNEIISIK